MRLKTLFAFLAAVFCASVHADPLAVGADAPKLTATDHNGKAVKLEDVYKKGPTLVFFYPKANTGGCTKEVCGLRDKAEDLSKLNLQILGVSMDKVEDQKSFVDKQSLKFQLLADPKGEIVKAFGVPQKLPGFASRQSFIVKDGKIAWVDTNVKPDEHAGKVQAALEALKK